MPGPSPIEAPHTYPGEIVTDHCTITPDAVLPFTVPDSDRNRVLAIGSNGSAAQLRRKFRHLDRWEVPVVMVDAQGLEVSYSAHVARHGYIPWAPIRHARLVGSRRFPLLWLTDEQLRVLDETEPNYTRTVLPESHQINAAADVSEAWQSAAHLWLEHHGDIWVYRSKRGVIGDRIGNPVPASDQETALFMLGVALGMELEHELLASDTEQREHVATALQSLSVRDGF